jgi:hypothetical protein
VREERLLTLERMEALMRLGVAHGTSVELNSGGRTRRRKAWRGRFRAPATDSFDEGVARDEAELVGLLGRRGDGRSCGDRRRPSARVSASSQKKQREEEKGFVRS